MSTSSEHDSKGAPSNLTPQTLNIVRLALLTGVLGFGAYGWFSTRNGGLSESLDPEVARVFQYAFIALFLGVMAGMAAIRRKALDGETFAKKAQFSLIGYALGEGVALFGGVYLLVSGSMTLYLAGLLVFLLAFVLFPIPENNVG